jgi:hypothetical protein
MRIRDVYPGSEFFHPGSRVKKIPVPVSESASMNLNILAQKLFPGSWKMIRNFHSGSGIRILNFLLPIPDPGSSGKKALDPGSATLRRHQILSKKEMFNAAYIYRHSQRREERSAEPRLLMSPPPPPPPSTPLSSGGTKPRSSRLSLSRPAQKRGSGGSVPAVDHTPLQQQQEAPFQQQEEAPFQQQQEAPTTLPDDNFQVSVCM